MTRYSPRFALQLRSLSLSSDSTIFARHTKARYNASLEFPRIRLFTSCFISFFPRLNLHDFCLFLMWPLGPQASQGLPLNSAACQVHELGLEDKFYDFRVISMITPCLVICPTNVILEKKWTENYETEFCTWVSQVMYCLTHTLAGRV